MPIRAGYLTPYFHDPRSHNHDPLSTHPFARPAVRHRRTRVVPLNDTGQSLCYDSVGAAASCATVADDGRYGRDAANTAGALTKTGAGTKGFDFTKIANNDTTLAVGAALGANPTDWACTQGKRIKNHLQTIS